MAQSRIAQDGGFDYSSGDVGGTDRCGEDLIAETPPGHNGQSPDLTLRREDGHDPAPRHREADGRRTAADFGITEWTPYRRPWFRKPTWLS